MAERVDRRALQARADDAWNVAHDARRPHTQREWARHYYRDVRRLLKALPPEPAVTITNLHTPEPPVRIVPVLVEGRLRS